MMKIRPADSGDAEEVSRFVSGLAATFIGPTLAEGGLEKLLGSLDLESTLIRMKDGFRHWLAVDEGGTIGVVVVKPPSHLYHLFVEADRQRSGVGRLLLEKAIQSVVETSGCDSITVNASLNAEEAYRRFGFCRDLKSAG